MKQFQGRLYGGRLFAGRLFRGPSPAVPELPDTYYGATSTPERSRTLRSAQITRNNQIAVATIVALIAAGAI